DVANRVEARRGIEDAAVPEDNVKRRRSRLCGEERRTQPRHSRIAITLLFLRRRGGLGGGLLFPARAAENVAQTGVAFVARVFADGIRHVILLASLRGDYGADLHRTHRDRRGGSATCPGERPRVEEPQQVVDTGELMDIFLMPAYAELRQAMAKLPVDRKEWATEAVISGT